MNTPQQYVVCAAIAVASFLGGAFYQVKNPIAPVVGCQCDPDFPGEIRGKLNSLREKVAGIRSCQCVDRGGRPIGAVGAAAESK